MGLQEFSGTDLIKCYAATPASAFQLIAVDSKYTIPTQEGLNKLLAEVQTNHFHYTAETFDCDDFALAFKSLSNIFFGINGIGWVLNFSGQHSYNVVFTHDQGELSLSVVEPQQDATVAKTQQIDHYAWKPKEGLVIL